MNLETNIGNFLNLFLKKAPRHKHSQIRYACRNFCEQSDRILQKCNEATVLEKEIYKAEEKGENLNDYQKLLVDRLESLYERIYSGILTLNKIMQLTGEKDFPHFPFGSASKSIVFFQKKLIIHNEKDLNNLRNVLEARSDFIIHQNKLNSREWYTQSDFSGKCRVIYMSGIGKGRLQNLSNYLGLNNNSFKIFTCFKCERAIVPPHHIEILKSWDFYAGNILEKISECLNSD